MIKPVHLLVFLSLSIATLHAAQVSITRSAAGWQMANGNIRVELVRSSQTVELKSLRRDGGPEWAVADTPIVAIPDKSGNQYRFSEDIVSDLPRDGKQLNLRFKSPSGGLLSLMLRMYPTGAVIELATRFENLGQHDLVLDSHIDPLCFTLKNPPGNLTPYSSVQGQHGFQTAGSLSGPREFSRLDSASK